MSSSGIAGFTRLSPLVSLHTPSPSESTSSSPIPLLIICAWMDASPKHIEKYTNQYIILFPNTKILLITSSASVMLFKSTATLSSLLQPALDVVLSLSPSEQQKLSVALYSNGGSFVANTLAKLYRETTSKSLGVVDMVLDSAPGIAEINAVHRAMVIPLPKTPPFSYLFSGMLWASLWIWQTTGAVLGWDDPIQVIRKDLNDSFLWGDGQGRKRVYIYSKEDSMVPYTAVLEHAEEAKGKGWNVKVEEFEGSKHVAHAVVDKERYWTVVKGCLEA